MVKFSKIPNTMQAVINGEHYIVTKNTDFSEKEAELIAKHLGLVIEGKSSKQATTTTTNTFNKK